MRNIKTVRLLNTTCFLLVLLVSTIGFGQNANQGNSGAEILKNAIAAAGGVGAINKIDNFRIRTESKIYGQHSTIELIVSETAQFPDKTKQVFELATGKRIQVLNGQTGWKKSGDVTTGLSELEKREMKRGLFRDTINLFKQFESENISTQYFGEEVVGGDTLFVLQIKNKSGDFLNIYVNSKTYLIDKKSYQGGPEIAVLATLQEIYSDYREVDGIKIPFHIVVKANGRKFIESKVVEAELNVELGAEFFMKE